MGNVHAGRLAWHERGPLDDEAPGEPVLMIMGLAAGSRLWYRLVPCIGKRHLVILFDNRGTGDPRPVRWRQTRATMANDALAVRDQAGIESATVDGASLGG